MAENLGNIGMVRIFFGKSLVVETDDNWTKKKIKDAIHTETDLLRKAILFLDLGK